MKIAKFTKVLAIFVILSIISSIIFEVYAVTESDKTNLQNQIDQAKDELSNISSNKENAQNDLESLTNQISDAENNLAELKAQLTEVNNQIAEKEAEIQTQEKEIKAKDELLRKRMVALYEAGDTSYLDVLMSSADLIDFMSGYSAIQTILEADTNLINKLEEQKEELEKNKTQLEENKQKVQDLKNKQEIKNATLVDLKEKKAAQISSLTADEQAKQSEIDSYNAAMVRVNEELEEAYRKAQEQINKGNSSSEGSNGLQFDGSFVWPCNCKIVTSTMKYRWGKLHKGIDIGASYESVYASASGYAYNAYDRNGYGTYIMIFHGDGYVSLYGHLDSSKISNGEYVSQGETIAISGNSGGSTGPHLHFELRQANSVSQFFTKSPLNPLDYLPGGYTLQAGADRVS